jgi:hypothetical protein
VVFGLEAERKECDVEKSLRCAGGIRLGYMKAKAEPTHLWVVCEKGAKGLPLAVCQSETAAIEFMRLLQSKAPKKKPRELLAVQAPLLS